MKKLMYFMVISFLISCQSDNEADKIKQEIKEKEDKISELKREVADLESRLTKMDAEKEISRVLVDVDEVKPETFNHYFEVTGTVESINEAFISPEINGQIREIYVSEGQAVSRGKLLVKLSTSITENTIEEVRTSLELATTVYKKQKQLWEKNIGSEMQYLEARNRKESLESKLNTLEAQLEMAYIRAPFDGIVDEIFQKEGELAVPGLRIMQVINLDQLYVNADVPENYLPVIEEGEMVTLRFPSYPELKLKEPVRRIGHVIDPQSRTFTIQLRIRNRNARLKPNILAIVRINDYTADSAMVVPSRIMKEDRQGTYLYIASEADGNLVAEKLYVKTGKSYKNETEILSGLQPGDRIVVEGFNVISDGTAIKTK